MQFTIQELFRDGTMRAENMEGETRYFGLQIEQIGAAVPNVYACTRHWNGEDKPSLDWLVENSLSNTISVEGT